MVLPSNIDRELWSGFVEMRKAMRNVPFTECAQRLILQKLQEFAAKGLDPNESLRNSIERGWRGVFEPTPTQLHFGKEAAPDTGEQFRATQAFERVKKWLSANYHPGITSLPQGQLTPTQEYALQVAGGPSAFLNRSQETWTRKKFVDAYIGIHKKLAVAGIKTREAARQFIARLAA